MSTDVEARRPPAVAPVPRGLPSSVSVLIAALVGGAVGTLEAVADSSAGLVHGALNVITGSGAGWLLATLLCGALSRRLAAAIVTGVATLCATVVSYYTVSPLLGPAGRGPVDLTAAAMAWGGLAIVAGPIFGVLGWLLRQGTRAARTWAVGLAGGALASQGVYLLSSGDPAYGHGAINLVVAYGSVVAAATLIIVNAWGRRIIGAVIIAVPLAFLLGRAWVGITALP